MTYVCQCLFVLELVLRLFFTIYKTLRSQDKNRGKLLGNSGLRNAENWYNTARYSLY